ncbi:hypothetical protein C8035_v009179 [Colletotrichum spinosum]|uniref:Uncharacterized protein n=1 Tax=Colletotrichum spinosum TaxID=1347390 RepID=A0A4R8QA46_9PEZI|nr:hypothetical protein C8035_v009179 [Colletotrichum spinosum]
MDDLSCQTSRAPDYYGAGVRFGIYFSWANAYVANTLLTSEMAGAADANTIFLVAILVSMVKCSSVRMLTAVDGLVLMHLSGGFLFGTLSIWGYRTRAYADKGSAGVRHFGGFGTHARLLVSVMIAAYGLWYWVWGIFVLPKMGSDEEREHGDVDNSDECQDLRTFMFANVRAEERVRVFYIVVCIGCVAYYGVMLLASSIAGWVRARTMYTLYEAESWTTSSRLLFTTGLTHREHDVMFQWLRWLNLAFLIYSVLLVEFTLRFNHVNLVLGGPDNNELHLTAQLLPLVVGLFGFVRTTYLLLETLRSPDDILPSLGAPARGNSARTLRPRDLLLVFSPAMARERKRERESHLPRDSAVARHRGPFVRYLVAWLPWLSLLEFFTAKRPAMKDIDVHGGEYSVAERSPGSEMSPMSERVAHSPGQENFGVKRKPVPYRDTPGEDQREVAGSSRGE